MAENRVKNVNDCWCAAAAAASASKENEWNMHDQNSKTKVISEFAGIEINTLKNISMNCPNYNACVFQNRELTFGVYITDADIRYTELVQNLFVYLVLLWRCWCCSNRINSINFCARKNITLVIGMVAIQTDVYARDG